MTGLGKHPTKPRVAAVGLGRYFRKIEKGIASFFEIGARIDSGGRTPSEGWLYAQLQKSGAEIAFLLTPNEVHAQQIQECAGAGVGVFVEKPLVTTMSALQRVAQLRPALPLLYCSDFYADVRAIPLMTWFGKYTVTDDDRMVISGNRELWECGSKILGTMRTVTGVLLEGEGDAASFDGREWLWDPIHGGVLWDLAYHYLTLWYQLTCEPLELKSARGKIENPGGSVGRAETCAQMSLVSAGGVHVEMEVGKYHVGENRRWLLIEGTDGSAKMVFGRPNKLVIARGQAKCTVTMEADYYAAVGRRFYRFLQMEDSRSHGFDAARVAIPIVIEAKQAL